MKTYVYYCPVCKDFYRYDTDSPNDVPTCPDCGILTRFTGYTQEELDALTPEEKEATRQALAEKLKLSSASLEESILQELRKVSKKVSFLYGFVIALLVLWGLTVLAMIM